MCISHTAAITYYQGMQFKFSHRDLGHPRRPTEIYSISIRVNCYHELDATLDQDLETEILSSQLLAGIFDLRPAGPIIKWNLRISRLIFKALAYVDDVAWYVWLR